MTGRPPIHPDDEERIEREMTAELEALMTSSSVAPNADFSDRVMSVVAHEPLPQPARAFGLAVMSGRARAAMSAVGDAWRVAVGGFAPTMVRAQALALVLVVAVASVAFAGGATVGALNLLTPPTPPNAPLPSLSPSPPPTATPSPSPSPLESVGPTDTAEPTQTAEPTGTDDHGGRTPRPTATGTDDHGGGGESGSGDSGSGGGGSGSGGSGSGGSGSDGSGSGRTPGPAETDDHGGGGDG